MQAPYTLKIERAKHHIRDASNLLRERRPFRKVLKTNYQLGQRAIVTECNERALADFALMAGDAVHNLRSALDLRIYALVAPHCTDSDKARIQFPFPKSNSVEDIKSAFNSRKIDKAPAAVWDAFKSLKIYPSGDANLAMLHHMDVIDKHKLLIPTADYAEFDSGAIQCFAPEYPFPTMASSNNVVDALWEFDPEGHCGPVKEEELPIPVQIVIRMTGYAAPRPVLPTLLELCSEVESAIEGLKHL